jgi:two-component system phosphate regulon sensor histidine kinase PhoR
LDEQIRVIVIDDEEGMREGMRRVLQKRGFSVDQAEDGESALRLLKLSRYDLALVDLKMPGIDGFEVTRYINENIGDATVVVIVSALATVEAAVEVTRHGAFDFLVKPFTPKDLMEVVERAARQHTLIRERERYLTELGSERNLSRQLINSMHEGVIVLNRNRLPVLLNPTAESFLGVSYRSGMNIEELGLGDEALGAIDAALASSSGEESARALRRQVGERMLQFLITPYLRGEERLGAILILEDITLEWQAELEKSRFIAMVAHELKSPIAAILNYVNIILTGMFDDKPDKIHEMLARSKIRGEALLDLIRDLLYLNQREAGKVQKRLERLALREVLASQLEFFRSSAERSKVSLLLEPAEGEFPVMADRKDLDRIFMNLISNGIKYNRENGTLTIRLSDGEGTVRVEVSDTGIGMSREEMGSLFQDFYRVKNPSTGGIPGTGLGLATVKRVASEYHGSVEVASEPEKGTTFTVTLPRV